MEKKEDTQVEDGKAYEYQFSTFILSCIIRY